MSKKRKTRREKKLADIRKVEHYTNSSQSQPTVAYTFATENKKNRSTAPTLSDVVDHSYVMQEVRKTLFISAFLVTFNLIVYALLSNNIIHLNFFG